MANFGCRIWSNTGFNAANIPDSPALLNALPFNDYPALDLNQERFLGSIRIKASWDNVKNADYCRVGDFFYTIENITMTSPDVAMLTLTPDYITSAGGVGSLNILDGITSRVHVSDDTYGAYGEADPLTAPSRPLKIVTKNIVAEPNPLNYVTVVESSLDLIKMGERYNESEGIYDEGAVIAVSGTESGDEEDPTVSVTFPTVYQNQVGTAYAVRKNGDKTFLPAYESDGTTLGMNKKTIIVAFNTSVSGTTPPTPNNPSVGAVDNTVQRGISVARALGVEGAISAQYAIPRAMCSFLAGGNGKKYSQIIGEAKSFGINELPFEYGTAKNKRVFYGNYTPYGIVTGNGSKGEFLAERVYDANTAPVFCGVADPRLHGRIYYRFATLDQKTSVSGNSLNDIDFFRDSVPSNNWQSIPIIYAGKSGSMVERNSFNAMLNEQIAQARYNFDKGETLNQLNQAGLMLQLGASVIGGIDLGVDSAMSYGAKGFGVGFADGFSKTAGGGGGGMLTNMINAGVQQADLDEMRRRQMSAIGMEMQAFETSQAVYMPTINFPDAEQGLYSALSGEGCVVYRYEYDPADIARIDKLLTMFGYKHTKAIEATDFTNRTYFNFVQGGVTVGGNLPRWWCNGISAQIGGGVRVWHVKPNHSYYSNNPIR